MAGIRSKMLKHNIFTVEHDGEEYQLCKLSGASLAEMQKHIAEFNADESLEDGQKGMKIAALMLIFSLLEDGELAFTFEDVDFVVNDVPVGLVTKIGKAVNKENGLSDSEEDVAKNS